MTTFPTRTDGQVIDSTWFNPLQQAVVDVHDTIFYAANFPTIQSAINTANISGGGTILIPPGTFDVELTLFSNIHLMGAGPESTVLRLPNGTNGSAIISSDGFALNTGTSNTLHLRSWSISNLAIDGNRPNNTAGRGIQIYGYDGRLFHINEHEAAQDGIFIEYGGNVEFPFSKSIHSWSVKAHYNGNDGFRVKTTDAVLYSVNTNGNNQSGTGGSGIHIDVGGTSAQLIGCHASRNEQEYALRVDAKHVSSTNCQWESGSLGQIFIGQDVFRSNDDTIYKAGPLTPQNGLVFKAGVTGTQIKSATRNFDGPLITWGDTTGRHHIRLIDYNSTGAIESGIRPPNADVEVIALTQPSLISKPTSEFRLNEDFMSGLGSDGNVGELGWDIGPGGGSQMRPGEAGHPGIFRRTTSTTAGTYAAIQQALVIGGDGPLLGSETFETHWIMRPNNTDSNTTMRLGLGGDALADPPANGMYFEKLGADTNWFVVTRAASTETRTDTGVAVAGAWTRFRIRRVDSSTIGFSLNDATEIEHTTNIPTVDLNPFTGISNNAQAANKFWDHDRFSLLISGLSR